MRLIDADALIREECGSCDGHCNTFDGEECLKCTSHNKCQLREAIDAAPTIDAEPVRLGFWKWGLGFPYCSECKMMAHEKGFVGYHTSDYCPNCGTKMDGGKQDA